MTTGAGKVLLGMSGGVDSSVSAWLLSRAGHEVIGVTLRTVHFPESAAADAASVARRLGIEHRVVDASDEFERRVVAPFIEEYRRGRTPNPCVLCNRELKFALLEEIAERVGARRVATGHYARLTSATDDRPPMVARSGHGAKDQSYFLCRLARAQIDRLVLPLGERSKAEIREIAAEIGLPVHDKPESQDVCFVPDGRYDEFIAGRLGDGLRSGDIVETDGTVVGRHSGIERFTVGQRRGLGLGGGPPRYVVAVDPKQARVVVGDDSDLLRRRMIVDDCVWADDVAPPPSRAHVQLRHRHRAAAATVREDPGDPGGERAAPAGRAAPARMAVEFDDAQRAIAPGQAAAFYDGDRVIGGGWIERSEAVGGGG